MAVSTKTLNSVNLDSFFQDRILDNNGISVTDINAGLVNLFRNFNENADNFEEEQHYLVKAYEDGYPDLVAKHSILGNMQYWWWILLLNRLENPMTDIKENWVYSINNEYDITSFIDKTNKNPAGNKNKIGTIVELN